MRIDRLMFYFIGVLSLAAFSSVAGDGASLAQEILRYDRLSTDRQAALVERLSPDGWKKLSRKERMAMELACYERSREILGKNSEDRLKVVRDKGDKLILKRAGNYLDRLPPEEIVAHPAAGDIYGDIPENAPRASRSVEIDPAVVRWHSTGLYVAPGEVVELVFPDQWVGRGLRVHVSGHRDTIPLKKPLRRTPASPSRTFPVKEKMVKVAGAYGGAIYIDTGGRPRGGGVFDVEIDNALEAPCFVLGKTDVKKWRDVLRHAPAPYAEFVTDRVAFSFPSEWIRDLDDPTGVLQYWDRVVALHDELGGMAHLRHGPERVNVDIQISAGLFHSGYPTQGPQKHCRAMLDFERLKVQGNWGWVHELGHEAQRRPDKVWGNVNPYTFDGSVETTVNLFSTHALDRLGIDDRRGWSWTASAEAVERKARKALAMHKPFAELGPGEKLAMYLQLRDHFGWPAIQTLLTSYTNDQDTDSSVLPKSNQAKRDAFLARMSLAARHNLAPFMQDLWGIPLSPEAIRQVEHLPVWMPAGFGGKDGAVEVGYRKNIR